MVSSIWSNANRSPPLSSHHQKFMWSVLHSIWCVKINFLVKRTRIMGWCVRHNSSYLTCNRRVSTDIPIYKKVAREYKKTLKERDLAQKTKSVHQNFTVKRVWVRVLQWWITSLKFIKKIKKTKIKQNKTNKTKKKSAWFERYNYPLQFFFFF